jgi:hypothetical protein
MDKKEPDNSRNKPTNECATAITTPKFRPRFGPIGEYDYPLLLGDRIYGHF